MSLLLALRECDGLGAAFVVGFARAVKYTGIGPAQPIYLLPSLGFLVRLDQGTTSCAMSVFQEIKSLSPDLSTPDLLRFLIKDRFAGQTLVTASLKAPSVVVLKMVADIDPATPVVFCIRGFQFPESAVYRQRIVDLLGLENVSLSDGGEVEILPGDGDYCERMWAESRDWPTRRFEIIHLNGTRAPYRCWICSV